MLYVFDEVNDWQQGLSCRWPPALTLVCVSLRMQRSRFLTTNSTPWSKTLWNVTRTSIRRRFQDINSWNTIVITLILLCFTQKDVFEIGLVEMHWRFLSLVTLHSNLVFSYKCPLCWTQAERQCKQVLQLMLNTLISLWKGQGVWQSAVGTGAAPAPAGGWGVWAGAGERRGYVRGHRPAGHPQRHGWDPAAREQAQQHPPRV